MNLFIVRRLLPNFSMGGKSVTATWHVRAEDAEDIWKHLPHHKSVPRTMGWSIEIFPTLDLGEFCGLEHEWVQPGWGHCERCGYKSTFPDNSGPCIPKKVTQ